MDSFGRIAFFTIAWDASFAAIAAAVLMVIYSFDPPLAFFIGASVALFFTGVMLTRALFLTEYRIQISEPWQAMEPSERPVGDDGLRKAQETFESMLLRFAKASSGISSTLFGFALLASWI
jgi:hypothetical protein